MENLDIFEVACKYFFQKISEFNAFFEKTYTADIERISTNEEIGRYEFMATNSKGDRIQCMIYLSGEWNIPLVYLSAFVTARYKNVDYV